MIGQAKLFKTKSSCSATRQSSIRVFKMLYKFAGNLVKQSRRYSTQSLGMPSTGTSSYHIKHRRAMSESQQIKEGPRNDDKNQTVAKTWEIQESTWCSYQ